MGLALVDHGRRIVGADSHPFGASGAAADLAIVSVPAALSGGPALVGFVGSGQFPREMAVEPGGKVLLVTNYGSGQLEAAAVADLP